jgi:chorismate synthase
MSFNTFGKFFRFTTWGESHGPAIGCIIDGCPPLIQLKDQDIQKELDKRKPGQSKFTTQRKESDKVQILSGVFEGKTTGTPISLIIYNEDMRSKDYKNIKDKFRPGHADLLILKNMELEIIEVEEDLLLERQLQELLQGAIAKKVLEKKVR